MPPSDRFKPIQKLTSQKERKAAATLGESLTRHRQARQRLDSLRSYLAEYLERFERAARNGLSGPQAVEFQVFIRNLENAIAQQELAVAETEQHCDSSKQQWRGRYSKSKAMDKAVDRMKVRERREGERREQAETDERAQRKR